MCSYMYVEHPVSILHMALLPTVLTVGQMACETIRDEVAQDCAMKLSKLLTPKHAEESAAKIPIIVWKVGGNLSQHF